MKCGKTEEWIADHSLKIFAVVAVAMIAAGYFGVRLIAEQEAERQVNVLKPQVTKVVRAANVCNAKALSRKRDSSDCAARLRIALINCREHPRCRAAFLATLIAPPSPAVASEGGDAQNPLEAGQQPDPGSPGGGNGGAGGGDHGGAGGGGDHSKPKPEPDEPIPSPTLEPPPAAAPGPEASPGASGSTPADEGGKGVKACVNLIVSACVEADPGLSG